MSRKIRCLTLESSSSFSGKEGLEATSTSLTGITLWVNSCGWRQGDRTRVRGARKLTFRMSLMAGITPISAIRQRGCIRTSSRMSPWCIATGTYIRSRICVSSELMSRWCRPPVETTHTVTSMSRLTRMTFRPLRPEFNSKPKEVE